MLDLDVDDALDHARGAAEAPVTLVEYADFECPYCGGAHPALKELARRMGDRLRIVFRHFPLTQVHPHAEAAARAAEAAAQQERFWEMHDLLFENQRRLERDDLIGYAGRLGLDLPAFKAPLDAPATQERVERDVASGERSGVPGTPALYLNGEPYDGFYDVESLEDAAEAAARGSS